MVNIEDAPRLRELCEKASKEFDHEKLIDLIRQINELLQKGRRNQGDPGKQASAFPGSISLTGYLSSWPRLARPLLDDPASGGVEEGRARR